MRMTRILAWFAACLLALVVAASFHPFVRNVYRAFRPSGHYDAKPPAVPELADPAVLVFTKTNGRERGRLPRRDPGQVSGGRMAVHQRRAPRPRPETRASRLD